jgi:hypothetical protein
MFLRTILGGAVALLMLFAPSAALAKQAPPVQVVTVYHQAVTPTAISGSGLGTVRLFFIPMAVNGKAADDQFLVGSLTTVAQGLPGNQELRASNLTFVFGAEENQLVVGGISLYPSDGATIAPGTKTVRPVIGGSGIYDGARGQVFSTNLGADGWTHVFRLRFR